MKKLYVIDYLPGGPSIDQLEKALGLMGLREATTGEIESALSSGQDREPAKWTWDPENLDVIAHRSDGARLVQIGNSWRADNGWEIPYIEHDDALAAFDRAHPMDTPAPKEDRVFWQATQVEGIAVIDPQHRAQLEKAGFVVKETLDIEKGLEISNPEAISRLDLHDSDAYEAGYEQGQNLAESSMVQGAKKLARAYAEEQGFGDELEQALDEAGDALRECHHLDHYDANGGSDE